MNRRQFIFNVSSFLLALSVTPAWAMSNMHICTVEVEFLKNQSLKDFKRDRDVWMNFAEFEDVVSSFQKQKLLVKVQRKSESNVVRISYYFIDRASHDKFVQTIHNADTVGEAKMAELGYRFSRKYTQT